MLSNLKIGTRLAFGFGALLLLLCAVAGLGMYQTARVHDNVVELVERSVPGIKVLGDMRGIANTARRASQRHLLSFDAADKDAQAKGRRKLIEEEWPAILDAYQPLVTSPEEARLLEDIKIRWAAYLVDDMKLIALSASGEAGFDDARRLAAGVSAASFSEVIAAIGADIEFHQRRAVATGEFAAARYRSVLQIDAAMMVFAVIVGTVMGVVLTRSVTRPLDDAVRLATKVAGGDLSTRIDAQGRNETAQLMRALGDMQASLGQVVGSVRTNSEIVALASVEIAKGNLDLSQRTEEQAGALQQTAATMEQLSTAVRHNVDSARQASLLAQGASAVAGQGGDVTGQVVATMQQISDSSRRIGDITSLIDSIAFQTNILALNASVEAARAGEQGRGFAVVASEVRSLAQRSADAAREIKRLIACNVEQVAQGTALVDRAGETMAEIVGSIRRVSAIVGEIAAASAEQGSGISQVGDAVAQMDQVTQQNAALVEEGAAAAESLKYQAQQLVRAVAVFKLGVDRVAVH